MKDRHCWCSGIKPTGEGDREISRQYELPGAAADDGERCPLTRGCDFWIDFGVLSDFETPGSFFVRAPTPLLRLRDTLPAAVAGLRLLVLARASSSLSGDGSLVWRLEADRVVGGK